MFIAVHRTGQAIDLAIAEAVELRLLLPSLTQSPFKHSRSAAMSAAEDASATAAGQSYPAALQFHPFSSAVDVSFWTELGRLKLDVLQLSSAPIPITAAFTSSTHTSLPPQLLLGSYSFDPLTPSSSSSLPSYHCPYPGLLHNANTLDAFKTLDTTALLASTAASLWAALTSAASPAAASAPHAFDSLVLNRFLLLTYADLKAHRYYYWFAFPALIHPSLSISLSHAPHPLLDRFPLSIAHRLISAVSSHTPPPPFFVIATTGDALTLHPIASLPSLLSPSFSSSSSPPPSLLLGFIDPCPLPHNPGWPLRNLLLYAALCGLHSTAIVAFRDLTTPPTSTTPTSLVLHVNLTYPPDLAATPPRCVGFERNSHGKLAPRLISLQSLMSPLHLAAASVNLNLRLMRWRALPALDLAKLASTRVLLLGAGTLGCNVARLCLAWGVTKLTLVDSGVVSYSNPVRQSLYRHEDCVGGGRAKAECAAERLKEVYPGVEVAGVKVSIPMVGHWSAGEDDEMRRGVQVMEQLVDAHDVVFQLTDSRESRWLPTVLCAGKRRLCINAALGFDTFVVMRHGQPPPPPLTTPSSSSSSPPRLGCYFCNDVVAPTDSSKDRTLDQQCTVTRPGLAYLASAYAVELMVNVLHAKEGGRVGVGKGGGEVGLEGVPHQLRGFLGSFEVVRVEGRAFDRCTGCGERMVEGYVKGGEEWVMAALRGGAEWLEEQSGLKEMKVEMEKKMQDTDWVVEEDDEEDGVGGEGGEHGADGHNMDEIA